MKTKKKVKKIRLNLAMDFFAVCVLLFVFTGSVDHGSVFIASAEETAESTVSYPYTQTFTISAYYSPLPCQSRYSTGSYNGDIRLNGYGVHGADGTPVYPGMIAAPSSYQFGTKMYVPGVGIVSVHDRGGAIVNAGEKSQSFDRLDIWMGFGDRGLERALSWGKRTVEVTVYGLTDSVIEDIALPGYSEVENVPGDCAIDMDEDGTVELPQNEGPNGTFYYTEYDEKLDEIEDEFKGELTSYLANPLQYGDEGESVLNLQKELKKLNFYWAEPTGVYDDLTVHAVFKFQQARGIVADEDTTGAGYFGPMTRKSLNLLIGQRNYTNAVIAQTTKGYQDSMVAKKEDKFMLAEAN